LWVEWVAWWQIVSKPRKVAEEGSDFWMVVCWRDKDAEAACWNDKKQEQEQK
jgi:hypothetical protein